MSTGNWRGYGGGWRGNWRGRFYNTSGSYSGINNPSYTGRATPGNTTPTHSYDTNLTPTLTPASSPFIGSIPSISEMQVMRQRELEACPFEAWEVYLPSACYESCGRTELIITTFLRFFSEFFSKEQLDEIEASRVIHLDFDELIYDPDLLSEIPTIADLFRDDPDQIIGTICLAVDQILTNKTVSSVSSCEKSRLSTRLYNFSPVTSLKSLRASQYGKCVSVRGTVLRLTNIKPHITRMAFLCATCRGVQVLPFTEGKYVSPTKCPSRSCRSKSFFPLKSSPLTESVPLQSLWVQEQEGVGTGEGMGKVARSIECELTGDLVDSCLPGDFVTVTAVVKAVSGEQTRSSKERTTQLIYLKAISISQTKFGNDLLYNSELSQFTLESVLELGKIPSLFKLIVNSLCPNVYGHEMVKAGLILCQFGGVTKQQCRQLISTRGEIHTLLIGDPGQGKSQLLQETAALAPKGVFVCGNTATASSLTVSVTKEAGGGGDYVLEAGALVLGDCGNCCIDEFEKLSGQHQCLIEAMDLQSVNLLKAGIGCNLKARTSIVAAASPSGGHYNRAKSVAENIRVNSSILSRFDLIFILFDKPDEEMDHKLSKRMMAIHTGKLRKSKNSLKLTETGPKPSGSIFDDFDCTDYIPLTERLNYQKEEEFEPIPPALLQKFIVYARSNIIPKISPEAADVLKNFYTELRLHGNNFDCIPITTLHLESLVRLTEARARAELRDVATEEDAYDVIDVVKHSMMNLYSDGMGGVRHTAQRGAGLSQRNQVRALIAELTRISEIRASAIFSIDEIREVTEKIGIPHVKFEDVMFSLNNQCYLIKKGPMLFQLQNFTCL